LFGNSESRLGSSWLEEAELLVMTRVSLIISFADIISALAEEMVTSTTDKALCVVCNEGGVHFQSFVVLNFHEYHLDFV